MAGNVCLALEYGRPVKAVAIDPEFAVKKSRQFVCGGLNGQLAGTYNRPLFGLT